MNDQPSGVSNAFHAFMSQASGHAQAWAGMVQGLAAESALDRKTGELAYLAVLAALRLEGGVAFHVRAARQEGATREEVISAILV